MFTTRVEEEAHECLTKRRLNIVVIRINQSPWFQVSVWYSLMAFTGTLLWSYSYIV